MKRILFCFSLVAVSLVSQAQTGLDSLYRIWQDHTQSDSVRALTFTNYIFKGFLFSNPDTVYILADELIAFGKEANFPKAQASGFNLKGLSSWIKGDFPKALDYHTQSYKIKEQLGDQKGMAGSLINMGNIYNVQGDYPKALNYYQRGLKICEEIGEKNYQANALNNIGLIYKDQGDDTKALNYFTQSLKIWEELGDQKGMAGLLINMGTIAMRQDDNPKALD